MKIQVKVKPNSKQQSIMEEADGSLAIQLKAPLVEGKANDELIKLSYQFAKCLRQNDPSHPPLAKGRCRRRWGLSCGI
jgi:uncharacterized protein YggU (UPF0235/DUF167 family)